MARLNYINWISNQRARLVVSEFVFWFRNAIIVDHVVSLSVLVRISASGAKDDGSRDSIEGVEAEIQCE